MTLFSRRHHRTTAYFKDTNNAADFCFELLDDMSIEEGAKVEPVSIAVAICKAADLRSIQRVFTLGCGPIGVLC